MKKTDPFYKSARWIQTRESILFRDGYQCQMCKNRGLNRNAECVHHIFPLDQYSEYQWSSWNLISLCNKCHDEMHNHFNGGLSQKGRGLLRITAHMQNIPIRTKEETILVVGLRGCGKSTYCRNHLDSESICYDLDAIASAFRLRMPHEEYFKPARKMANDFLKGFIAKAHDYVRKVYIIRTAPTIKEVQEIDPDKVVMCMHQYMARPMDDKQEALRKLQLLSDFCKQTGIECEQLPSTSSNTPPQYEQTFDFGGPRRGPLFIHPGEF